MHARVSGASAVISTIASRCFARHAERTAVVFSERGLSYSQLGKACDRLAHALSARLPPRARIGVYLKNGSDYLIAYFGALSAGHVPFLVDANFNRAELEAIRDDCGVTVLLTADEDEGGLGESFDRCEEIAPRLQLRQLARPRAPRYELRSDTEVCRFTSGTTGHPKCIEFSGAAVSAAAHNWVEGTGLHADDRTLCLAALSNGLAFNTSLLATLLAGAELHLFAGVPLTRAVAGYIEKAAITRLVSFPSFYRLMVEKDGSRSKALTGLRCAISAGAPLWPDVRAAFHERFGVDISDYYGVAETGPCTFEKHPGHGTGLGAPLPGAELRIDDHDDSGSGELSVRTASMASCYLNYPGLLEARIDAQGFYASGDRGYVRDGRLFLTGRTQDFINVGGRKIDPIEIRNVVEQIAGVREAAILDEPDAHRESILHLVVDADDSLTPQILMTACRQRLAAYKVPHKVSFVEGLPKNGIGKLRTSELRRQLRETESKSKPPTHGGAFPIGDAT